MTGLEAVPKITELLGLLIDRVKDRQTAALVQQIQQHQLVIQAALMQSDATVRDLEKQLADSQAEDIRIHRGIEFRCGKRTGKKWQAFCPKCHMPAQFSLMSGTVHGRVMACTGRCGWNVFSKLDLEQLIGELEV